MKKRGFIEICGKGKVPGKKLLVFSIKGGEKFKTGKKV